MSLMVRFHSCFSRCQKARIEQGADVIEDDDLVDPNDVASDSD